MGAAIGWGALAASSLVVGAVLALVRTWSSRFIGFVLAFGAGALISAVSFELFEEGIDLGGGLPVAFGLAAGALTYVGLDLELEPSHPTRSRRSADPSGGSSAASASGGASAAGASSGGGASSGSASSGGGGDSSGVGLALGAFLDGIPEQMVLGVGLAGGAGVSISLLVAIFVSNLPEAIGSASEMAAGGRPVRFVVGLWAAVAVVCAAATVAGYALADAVSDSFKAGIDGFAAGALLVMLVDSMIPEAGRRAGRGAGLVTVLGFAVAAGLSALS